MENPDQVFVPGIPLRRYVPPEVPSIRPTIALKVRTAPNGAKYAWYIWWVKVCLGAMRQLSVPDLTVHELRAAFDQRYFEYQHAAINIDMHIPPQIIEDFVEYEEARRAQ